MLCRKTWYNLLSLSFGHFQSLGFGALGYFVRFSTHSWLSSTSVWKCVQDVIGSDCSSTCTKNWLMVHCWNDLTGCVQAALQSVDGDKLNDRWVCILSFNFATHWEEAKNLKSLLCKLLITRNNMRRLEVILVLKSFSAYDACIVLLKWCMCCLCWRFQSYCLAKCVSRVSKHNLTAVSGRIIYSSIDGIGYAHIELRDGHLQRSAMLSQNIRIHFLSFFHIVTRIFPRRLDTLAWTETHCELDT